jgi:hypothetical protein
MSKIAFSLKTGSCRRSTPLGSFGVALGAGRSGVQIPWVQPIDGPLSPRMGFDKAGITGNIGKIKGLQTEFAVFRGLIKMGVVSSEMTEVCDIGYRERKLEGHLGSHFKN